MTSQNNTSKTGIKADADLLAVRRLMEDSAQTVSPDGEQDRAQGESKSNRKPAVLRGRSVLPPLERAGSQSLPPQGGAAQKLFRSACRTAFDRAKTYRPERKRILWTSLVLMLLLQPFFVIGWSVFCVGLVVALYVLWGGDVFWRRLIAVYQNAARRWPEPARSVKLRAYVIGKKWDWIVDRMPDRLAEQLRAPDLRGIIAADAQHEAVLSERLSRL